MLQFRRLIINVHLILLSVLFPLTILKIISKSNVLEYCYENNLKINGNFYSNLVHIPDLNILFCDVPKAASTNLRRLIYVHFNQSKSYEDLKRQKLWLDYDQFFHQFYLTEAKKLVYRDQNLYKFVIVRHPFRRIYSAYFDKFINNDVENTMNGWKIFEEQILLEMNRNETLITIRKKNLRLDFRTFLLYIVHSIRNKKIINSHWEQIVQRCSICLIKYNWIAKIENFHSDEKFLSAIFRNMEFPSKSLDHNDENQPISLDDYQLTEIFRNTIRNASNFRVLVEYYKPDFQLFGYTTPDS